VVTPRDYFKFLVSLRYLVNGLSYSIQFGVHVDRSKSQPTGDKLSLTGAWSLSRDLFNFWKITDNISKTVRDSLIISIKFTQEVVCTLSNGYVADDLG